MSRLTWSVTTSNTMRVTPVKDRHMPAVSLDPPNFTVGS